MIVEVVLFSLFGLLLAAVAWWTWTQRQLAARQAEMNAQLAELGRGLDALAHDLLNLFAVVVQNVEAAPHLPPDELVEALGDVKVAAQSAAMMLKAVRGQGGQQVGQADTEGLLRLSMAYLRHQPVGIDLDADGTLAHRGNDADALRVVLNLLANAVREASAISGARVRVALRDDSLRIENPVRDASSLDERIYEDGLSRAGSSGRGLAIAKQAAARVGWRIRHELDGDRVCFVVEPDPDAEIPDSEPELPPPSSESARKADDRHLLN